MAEGDPRIHVVGVTGGEVRNSNVAGVVHGGMGNTTHNRHGDRTIHNSGTMGNAVTGDNNRGNISATFGSTSQKKASEDVTEDDIISVLKEKKLGKYESIFRDQGIDGTLLHKLSEDRLTKFGVSDDWDRERILNLKKHFLKWLYKQ